MKKETRYLVLALLVGALFSGCQGPAGPMGPMGSAGPAGAYGRLILTIGEEPGAPPLAARTLYPDASDLSRYELSFEGPSGAAHEPVLFTPGTSQTVDLLSGTWAITARAFKTGADTAAAQGSVSITLAAGQSTEACIILGPASGAGAFAYEVSIPGDLSSAVLTLTKIAGDGEAAAAPGSTILLAVGTTSGTLELDAGYYLLNIRLAKAGAGDALNGGRTEVVHIYPGLTTEAKGAAFVFTEADFPQEPPEPPEPPPSSGSLGLTIGLNLSREVTVSGYSGDIVLSRGAGASAESASVTLCASGYDSAAWYIDGDQVSGVSGDSITLNASGFDVRNHSLTFMGVQGGVVYAKLIPFRVIQDDGPAALHLDSTATPAEIEAAATAFMEALTTAGASPGTGEAWQIPIAGFDLSGSGAFVNLCTGIAHAADNAGITSGISLDLSACAGASVAYTEAQQAVSDRFVSLTLPASVTTLANGTGGSKGFFSGFTQLKRVKAPGLTKVGHYAFSGCTALEWVELPAVVQIGNCAFANCDALAAVTLGETPPAFGNTPFNGIANSAITLMVPVGAKGVYEAAYGSQVWGGTNVTVEIRE
jgi:hypothetical protein